MELIEPRRRNNRLSKSIHLEAMKKTHNTIIPEEYELHSPLIQGVIQKLSPANRTSNSMQFRAIE